MKFWPPLVLGALLVLLIVVSWGPVRDQLFLPEFVKQNHRAQVRWAGAQPRTELELMPAGPLARVPGAINGRQGFVFLLDTSSSTPILIASPRLEPVEFATQGTFTMGRGDAQAPTATIGRDVALGFGTLTLTGLAPLIIDWQDLPFIVDEAGIPFDGVIGYDLFRQVRAEIDFVGRRVVLESPAAAPRPGGRPDAVLSLVRNGRDVYTNIGIQPHAEGRVVQGQVHLDTGASGLSVVVDSVPGLKSEDDGSLATAFGLQGGRSGVVAVIHRLILGSEQLGPLQATLERAGALDSAMGRHGRLGADVLSRYRHVIDYRAGQVALFATARTEKPFPLGYLGLVAFPSAQGFQVVRVSENSPAAAAGLVRGDVIVEVDGRPADSLGVHGWFEATRELQPGDTVELCVAAQPATRCHRVTAGALSHG